MAPWGCVALGGAAVGATADADRGGAAASAALAVGIGASASAAGAAAAPEYRVEHVCGASSPGTAACAALRLVSSSLTSAELQANAARQAAGAGPARENRKPVSRLPDPAEPARRLLAAGPKPRPPRRRRSRSIDAFDDPTAEADLGVYDEQFGLPACTSANGCFRKVNEDGQPSPLPPTKAEWASEISIDVQMAHAICQSCHVLLVEAKQRRIHRPRRGGQRRGGAGATEISNSYAGARGIVVAASARTTPATTTTPGS